jgi:hypothetical protein
MADFEEQHRQAAEFYATLNDEELKQLAAEAWTLTEAGEQALRAELARRGLAVELAAPPNTDTEVARRHLITLRTFRDMPGALLAQGALTSAGVESFLMDETTIRMDWLWSNALGGIKLCVDRMDAPAAAQVLGQEIPAKFPVEGVGDFEQPRCPKCQSLDVSYEDLDKRVAYAGLLLVGFPIPVRRGEWKCQSCGHTWKQLAGGTSEQT